MDTQDKLIIDRILSTVAGQKASDLHLSVGNPPIIRLNDRLITLEGEPVITPDFMVTFIDSTLDKAQKKMLEDTKEVVLAYQFQKQARFRINIFYQKGVPAAYLRLIGNRIVPLNQLGLPPTIENLALLKKGLILISGSFGSGKTTTSASMIDHINRNRSAYILTVERPIEYIFTNQKSIVEQREVGRDTISFEQALSSITQEDVDVLFLSELSGPAVIRDALNIAAAGRLVIANLEADTTVKALELIINEFPSDEQRQIKDQLTINLQAVICQRLLPRVGGGRIAIAEIMMATPPVKSLLKEGSLYQLSNIIQTSRAEGMVALDWSLAELVKMNQVSLEDALANADDPQHLRYMLQA
jgi:twitching motility protein PilT